MPDVEALDEFIRLWDRWVAGQELGEGLAPFKHLFAQLRNVRPWGPQDRIPDETIAYWREEARRYPDRSVRTEVELWYRRTAQRREQVRLAFRALVAAAGGAVLHETLISEIAYQGVLINIPAAAIPALIARGNVDLALADDVMFLRPQTVLSAPAADALEDGAPIGHQSPTAGQPIAALLDGVPLQGHERLAGRLSLDDPDDLQARALVNRRFHGTAMASLVLHGDLNAPEPALTRPLYVRPLMIAPANLSEHTPSDRLLVDTLYNAIVRIKGVEGQPGVAPTVFLVNLSLGDRRRPFANLVSPLARLLDFLAAQYDIVFLVSAGNVPDQQVLPEFNQWTEFEAATPQKREHAVLTAMFAAKHERSLLSPAEAVNVLTIGAQHTDNVANRVTPVMAVDPFDDPALPNASCAMGLGYRRAVKPDLFLPRRSGACAHGRHRGRRPRRIRPCATHIWSRGRGPRLRKPGAPESDRLRRRHKLSDSPCDARSAQDFRFDNGPRRRLDAHRRAACVLCGRRQDASRSQCALERERRSNQDICGPDNPQQWVERTANATRFLGFGVPNIARVLDCAENQATLVGYGTLQSDHAHRYRIPLPRSLEGVTDPRQVSITLAWFTPVKAGHQSYRTVKLEADAVDSKQALGVSRFKDQPADPSVKKGTVFHERFSGERAVPFIDDGHLSVRVWCKDDAGNQGNAVRYAIAVTIEAGTPLHVYEEVRERLRVRARPPA